MFLDWLINLKSFLIFFKFLIFYGFSCVYFFHTIYPGRQSWEIISNTYFFFFPGSIHSGRILKHLLFLLADRKILIFLTNRCGLINFIFRFPILKIKNVSLLILEMLTIWDLVNLELLQKIIVNRLVILIETIATLDIVLIWLNVLVRKISFFYF